MFKKEKLPFVKGERVVHVYERETGPYGVVRTLTGVVELVEGDKVCVAWSTGAREFLEFKFVAKETNENYVLRVHLAAHKQWVARKPPTACICVEVTNVTHYWYKVSFRDWDHSSPEFFRDAAAELLALSKWESRRPEVSWRGDQPTGVITGKVHSVRVEDVLK